MSVHFVSNGGGKDAKLFGQPFPPDDVKAYWSMVPEVISVEWSTALGVFFVTKTIDSVIEAGRRLGGEDPQPIKRLQVMAKDATQLSTWMRVISELCCGK